jgi:YegS/Rv2252/BmrU family lipid kinase
MLNGKVHIIVNPVAGGGRAGQAIPGLHTLLRDRLGRDFSLHLTRYPGHATQLARRFILNDAALIVAVGGDGTIQEVVNGFFNERQPVNPLCELGIINFGTGEGFARTLRLPPTLEGQIALLLNSGHRQVDVGCIGFRNAEGIDEERLFVNECQLGIGAAVAAAVDKVHKQFGGKLAFGSAALKRALSVETIELTVQIDEAPSITRRLFGLVIANGCFTAGGMRLTPEALPDDGLFDILFIHEMNLFQRLLNFPRIYSGNHLRSPFFSVQRGRRLSIDSVEEGGMEADGELLGSAPCTISMLAAKVRVRSSLAPRESQP